MKKIILTSAIILTALVTSFAQEQLPSDQVTLNVILTPFQTISVNSGQKEVDLEYNAANKYSEGVSKALSDHLTVQSTGAFIVKVSSAAFSTNGSGTNTKTIESRGIAIEASFGSAELAKTQFTKVNLTQESKELISSGLGSLKAAYDVKYTGEKNNGYLNKLIQTGGFFEETTYTTTVTYSLEAV